MIRRDSKWYEDTVETLRGIDANLKEQGYSKEECDRILRKVCGVSELKDCAIIRSLRKWLGLD